MLFCSEAMQLEIPIQKERQELEKVGSGRALGQGAMEASDFGL